jgi:hypothetical protein
VIPSADAESGGEQRLPCWQVVGTLGVRDVVVAILEARKTNPGATAARVSREQRGGVAYVRVTLLGEPAEGRQGGELVAAFAVDQLREDLLLAFGHKDVIVLK